MNGKLYGVSAGPGDPSLITLKAVSIISKCRVIAAPQSDGGKSVALDIVSQAIDLSGKEIIYISTPMTRDKAALEQAHKDAAEMISGYLRSGEDVAILTLGDVSIYSSYSYFASRIADMGFETEMCAGVPSFCAAAAALNIPLTEGDEPMYIIPGRCEEANGLIAMRGTKVIMKSGKSVSSVLEALSGSDNRKISAVENCGMPDEKIYSGVDDIANCGYFTLIIAKD